MHVKLVEDRSVSTADGAEGPKDHLRSVPQLRRQMLRAAATLRKFAIESLPLEPARLAPCAQVIAHRSDAALAVGIERFLSFRNLNYNSFASGSNCEGSLPA